MSTNSSKRDKKEPTEVEGNGQSSINSVIKFKGHMVLTLVQWRYFIYLIYAEKMRSLEIGETTPCHLFCELSFFFSYCLHWEYLSCNI